MSKLIPRLEMEQLTPELQKALESKVKRLKYLGEFFKCMGNQPEALLSFNTFTEDLKKALPDDFTEVVALTVGSMMENYYERNQHERLSIKLGFGKQWVSDINALTPDEENSLNQEQRLIQKFAMAVISAKGRNVKNEFEAVIEAIGTKYAVAILMLIGRYMTHALIVNTFAFTAPVTSIFEDQ